MKSPKIYICTVIWEFKKGDSWKKYAVYTKGIRNCFAKFYSGDTTLKDAHRVEHQFDFNNPNIGVRST